MAARKKTPRRRTRKPAAGSVAARARAKKARRKKKTARRTTAARTRRRTARRKPSPVRRKTASKTRARRPLRKQGAAKARKSSGRRKVASARAAKRAPGAGVPAKAPARVPLLQAPKPVAQRPQEETRPFRPSARPSLPQRHLRGGRARPQPTFRARPSLARAPYTVLRRP